MYKLTQLAEQDIGNIFDYTIDNWGETQAGKYTHQLYSRFQWLADNPKLGMERGEIKEGYRSYFEGKHAIFYRETSEGVEIIGIAGQHEDVVQHLSIEQEQTSPKIGY